MVQPLPETVKNIEVHWHHALADTSGLPFDMKIAPDEVMVLLSAYYWWKGVLAAGANSVNMALWRKTDSNPPGGYWASGSSQDMIWNKGESIDFVTESLKAGNSEHMAFPWPIVLIRPPSLMLQTSVITDCVGSMRLYYLLRDIKDADLAKLMVKDHA